MNSGILASDNIRLRAVEPDDIDFLLLLENDSYVWKVSNTLAPYSRFQIEQFVMNAPSDIRANQQLRLIIEWRDAHERWTATGAVDLFEVDLLQRRAGVGILVIDEFRNRGIASGVLKILIQYAFNTLVLHQLYCNISVDNTPSIRLFEKSGFIPCGIKKDWVWDRSGWKDECMFQLLNHEQ